MKTTQTRCILKCGCPAECARASPRALSVCLLVCLCIRTPIRTSIQWGSVPRWMRLSPHDLSGCLFVCASRHLSAQASSEVVSHADCALSTLSSVHFPSLLYLFPSLFHKKITFFTSVTSKSMIAAPKSNQVWGSLVRVHGLNMEGFRPVVAEISIGNCKWPFWPQWPQNPRWRPKNLKTYEGQWYEFMVWRWKDSDHWLLRYQWETANDIFDLSDLKIQDGSPKIYPRLKVIGMSSWFEYGRIPTTGCWDIDRKPQMTFLT